MPTPTFPTTISGVDMNKYSFKPKDKTIRTEMETGLARVRRRYMGTPTEVTVGWIFSRAELGIFEKFFENDLQGGSAWFYINLVNGVGETQYLARFMEPYSVSTAKREFYWDVEAKLEVLARPLPA